MERLETHTITTIIKDKAHDAFDYWSLIIPVITFILGYFIVSFINLMNRKSEAKQNLQIFETYLTEQKAALAAQLNVIERQKNELSDSKYIKKTETIVHPFFLYDAMDKVKLLQSYRTLKKGTDEFVTKTVNVEKARSIVNAFESLVTNEIKLSNENRNEWNSLVKSLEMGMATLSNQLSEYTDENVLSELMRMMNICQGLNGENCDDFERWTNEYHEPLKKLFINQFTKTGSPLLIELVGYINQLTFIEKKQKNNRVHFIKAADTLKSHLSELQL